MKTRAPAGAAGFSLVELLITLLVVAEILVIAGLMFDLHNRTARAQNQVSDMQQSLRVAQREMVDVIRMAGRGGLVANLPDTMPGTPPDIVDGLAIEVENNVAAGTLIVDGDTDTEVVAGTDVLRVRGVFSAPLYQLVSSALETGPNVVYAPTPDDPASAESGIVVVNDPSPTGAPQDLQPLIDAARDTPGAALLMVSPLSDSVYGVVSLTGVLVDNEDDPKQVTLQFLTESGDHAPEYHELFVASNNLPDNLTGAAFIGLVEEHVFYVRAARAIPGDASSDLMPRLARTQVFPKTEVGVGDDHTLDIADNVLDLQVALGFNSDADGQFFTTDQIDQMVLVETADGANDDWLFNGASDDATASPWVPLWGDPDLGGTPQPQLQYVRLTTLVRTEGREFQYTSPPIERIEDRVYNEPRVTAGRDPEREFHRRLLRTVVDLRNL